MSETREHFRLTRWRRAFDTNAETGYCGRTDGIKVSRVPGESSVQLELTESSARMRLSLAQAEFIASCLRLASIWKPTDK